MSRIIKGKVFVCGSDINTDEIIPARYCTTPDLDTLGAHALEDLHESKYTVPFEANQYDIIIAGENFGCGSSREVAPISLAKAGVKIVLSPTFARIYYRNSINYGLPLSRNMDLVPEGIQTGDELEIDLDDERFWEGMLPIHQQIMLAGGLTKFNQSGQAPANPVAEERPQTLAEKILAKAAGVSHVKPGMIVYAEVDRVITHELTLPVAADQLYAAYGKDFKVHDPEKILFVADHTIQIPLIQDNWKSQIMVEKSAKFVEEQNLPHAFLPPAPFVSQGICHVLFPEKGLIRPDTLVVGTDSHTCTHGAFGCFAFGIGNTDLTEIMAAGRVMVDVPETIRVTLTGKMQHGVFPKDVILYILAEVTANGFTSCVVEFDGPGVEHLTADDRSTIANMTVEGGASCGIFAVGELRSDDGAVFKQNLTFDLDQLTPIVAPPFSPDTGVSVDVVEKAEIDVAWVGSCTGGKLEDVQAAADVIRGNKVAEGVKFIVAPSTIGVMEEAGRQGYLRDIIEAGGQIVQPGCGACIGMGPGTLKEGEVGVFASNRNFKGRAGKGNVFLASPASVAASAIEGKVADPRKYLKEPAMSS